MSSIRNSLHRRNHKERSQLSNRKRLGILEKHKDYVQRAKDFNQKKDKIKRLKQKVADKNKDEFYFGMVGKQTKNGIHYQDRGGVSMPIDLVNVLKSQDEGYLRTTKTANLKRIDIIKEELSRIVGAPGDTTGSGLDLDVEETRLLQQAGLLATPSTKSKRKIKHIVFIDDEASAEQYTRHDGRSFSSHLSEDVKEDNLGWKAPPSPRKLAKTDTKREETWNARDMYSNQNEALKELLPELQARLQRDTHLGYALRELEMQRTLMGKGTSRKIRGPELIKPDGEEDDELNEDEQDSLFGRRRKIPPKRQFILFRNFQCADVLGYNTR